MSKKYYVIVNLDTLAYQENGNDETLEYADKFDTIEEAKKVLETYDTDNFELAIYEVIEYTNYKIKKVEESNEQNR